MKTTTKICKICFNRIYTNNIHSFLYNEPICSKCLKELNPVFKKFKIEGIESLAIFEYNETLKKLIYQFKGCLDYELKDIFLAYFVKELKEKYKNYYILPIPSFKQKDLNRGFNQVEEIFSCLNLPILKDVLIKKRDDDQHLKSYVERTKVKDNFLLLNKEILRDKNILICDDVCTTGSSLKATIELIKSYITKDVKILVVAKREFSKDELEKIKDKRFVLSWLLWFAQVCL